VDPAPPELDDVDGLKPLDDREFEAVKTDVGRMWISRRDTVMRPYLQHRGCWEQAEGELLRALITPGCRFLDVGANIGYFSLFAARAASGVTIDCVEPHPDSLRALRFNLEYNRVAAEVWPVALHTHRTTMHLTTATTNIGDSRLGGEHGAQSHLVEVVPGDELFGGRGFDVVKIDVQGWELEVVLGLRATIERSPGMAIVAEFWPSGLRERGRDPYEVLDGYRDVGLEVVTQVDRRLGRLDDDEIVAVCDAAGPDGQVNLFLKR